MSSINQETNKTNVPIKIISFTTEAVWIANVDSLLSQIEFQFKFFSVFSLWNEWSDCSLTCDFGQKTRTRICQQNCDGVSSDDLSETKSCNEFMCSGEQIASCYRCQKRNVCLFLIIRLFNFCLSSICLNRSFTVILRRFDTAIWMAFRNQAYCYLDHQTCLSYCSNYLKISWIHI